MPLTIQLRDEHGHVIDEAADDGSVIRLVDAADPNSPCLRWVDSYGDTIFNTRQAEALALELRQHGDGSAVAAAAALADRCAAGVHLYLWFIGD